MEISVGAAPMLSSGPPRLRPVSPGRLEPMADRSNLAPPLGSEQRPLGRDASDRHGHSGHLALPSFHGDTSNVSPDASAAMDSASAHDHSQTYRPGSSIQAHAVSHNSERSWASSGASPSTTAGSKVPHPPPLHSATWTSAVTTSPSSVSGAGVRLIATPPSAPRVPDHPHVAACDVDLASPLTPATPENINNGLRRVLPLHTHSHDGGSEHGSALSSASSFTETPLLPIATPKGRRRHPKSPEREASTSLPSVPQCSPGSVPSPHVPTPLSHSPAVSSLQPLPRSPALPPATTSVPPRALRSEMPPLQTPAVAPRSDERARKAEKKARKARRKEQRLQQRQEPSEDEHNHLRGDDDDEDEDSPSPAVVESPPAAVQQHVPLSARGCADFYTASAVLGLLGTVASSRDVTPSPPMTPQPLSPRPPVSPSSGSSQRNARGRLTALTPRSTAAEDGGEDMSSEREHAPPPPEAHLFLRGRPAPLSSTALHVPTSDGDNASAPALKTAVSALATVQRNSTSARSDAKALERCHSSGATGYVLSPLSPSVGDDKHPARASSSFRHSACDPHRGGKHSPPPPPSERPQRVTDEASPVVVSPTPTPPSTPPQSSGRPTTVPPALRSTEDLEVQAALTPDPAKVPTPPPPRNTTSPVSKRPVVFIHVGAGVVADRHERMSPLSAKGGRSGSESDAERNSGGLSVTSFDLSGRPTGGSARSPVANAPRLSGFVRRGDGGDAQRAPSMPEIATVSQLLASLPPGESGRLVAALSVASDGVVQFPTFVRGSILSHEHSGNKTQNPHGTGSSTSASSSGAVGLTTSAVAGSRTTHGDTQSAWDSTRGSPGRSATGTVGGRSVTGRSMAGSGGRSTTSLGRSGAGSSRSNRSGRLAFDQQCIAAVLAAQSTSSSSSSAVPYRGGQSATSLLGVPIPTVAPSSAGSSITANAAAVAAAVAESLPEGQALFPNVDRTSVFTARADPPPSPPAVRGAALSASPVDSPRSIDGGWRPIKLSISGASSPDRPDLRAGQVVSRNGLLAVDLQQPNLLASAELGDVPLNIRVVNSPRPVDVAPSTVPNSARLSVGGSGAQNKSVLIDLGLVLENEGGEFVFRNSFRNLASHRSVAPPVSPPPDDEPECVFERTGDVTCDEDGNMVVNGVTLWQELGAGAMGTVFLGFDQHTDEPKAVKVVQRATLEAVGTEAEADGVVQEARIMARLRHPNIVRLFACIDDPKEPAVYMVMQYVPDGVIAEVNEAGDCPTLPASEVLHYATQMADALRYTHEQGVVHGDIKPDNIFVDRAAERCFLADFGISRAEAERRATVLSLRSDDVASLEGSAALCSLHLGPGFHVEGCGHEALCTVRSPHGLPDRADWHSVSQCHPPPEHSQTFLTPDSPQRPARMHASPAFLHASKLTVVPPETVPNDLSSIVHTPGVEPTDYVVFDPTPAPVGRGSSQRLSPTHSSRGARLLSPPPRGRVRSVKASPRVDAPVEHGDDDDDMLHLVLGGSLHARANTAPVPAEELPRAGLSGGPMVRQDTVAPEALRGDRGSTRTEFTVTSVATPFDDDASVHGSPNRDTRHALQADVDPLSLQTSGPCSMDSSQHMRDTSPPPLSPPPLSPRRTGSSEVSGRQGESALRRGSTLRSRQSSPALSPGNSYRRSIACRSHRSMANGTALVHSILGYGSGSDLGGDTRRTSFPDPGPEPPVIWVGAKTPQEALRDIAANTPPSSHGSGHSSEQRSCVDTDVPAFSVSQQTTTSLSAPAGAFSETASVIPHYPHRRPRVKAKPVHSQSMSDSRKSSTAGRWHNHSQSVDSASPPSAAEIARAVVRQSFANARGGDGLTSLPASCSNTPSNPAPIDMAHLAGIGRLAMSNDGMATSADLVSHDRSFEENAGGPRFGRLSCAVSSLDASRSPTSSQPRNSRSNTTSQRASFSPDKPNHPALARPSAGFSDSRPLLSDPCTQAMKSPPSRGLPVVPASQVAPEVRTGGSGSGGSSRGVSAHHSTRTMDAPPSAANTVGRHGSTRASEGDDMTDMSGRPLGLRKPRVMPGTPAFAAPELFNGAEPSRATDMWSLGMLLYALLFGRVPFHAATLPALCQAVCEAKLPIPADASPGATALATAVIIPLLQTRPEERMTAAHCHQALLALASFDRPMLPVTRNERVDVDAPMYDI